MSETLARRYTFKLYPTPAQESALHQQRMMMAELWNALLEMCETRWRREQQRLTWFDAAGERRKGITRHIAGEPWKLNQFTFEYWITELLAECEEWRALSTWTPRRLAKSLYRAFAAFWSRAKSGAGAQSGYPRYRSRLHWTTIPHRCASGCKLSPQAGERSGDAIDAASARTWRLALKGVVGGIRVRGRFPAAPSAYKDADIIYRDGAWWLSICVEMAPRRSAGADLITVHLDLLDRFARVERVEGRRSARVGSARVPAQSPNHLHDLGAGAGSDENAGSDERDPAVQAHRRRQSPGSDENAGSDERVSQNSTAAATSSVSTGSDENAGSDERGGCQVVTLNSSVTGSDENAGSDERGSDGARQTFVNFTAGSDENAGSDERASRAGCWRRRHPAGSDENAGSDERVVIAHLPYTGSMAGSDENAGSDERGLRFAGRRNRLRTAGSDENAGSDERVRSNAPPRPPRGAGSDENAGSDERGEIETASLTPDKLPPSSDENAGSDERACDAVSVMAESDDPSSDESAGSDSDERGFQTLGRPVPDWVAGSNENTGSDEREDSGVVDDALTKAALLCERADAIKSERDIRWPKRGIRSWRWRRETARAARLTGRATRIRREYLHRWSTSIVAGARHLTVIAPSEKTKSPKGSLVSPGANVETVSALNRHVLNQAPAAAVAMLTYKAAEANIPCDVSHAPSPAAIIAAELVAAGKAHRRITRQIRRAANG